MGGFIGYQNQTPGYYNAGAVQAQQLIDQQNAQRAAIAAQNKARADAIRANIEKVDEERKNWSREDYEKHLDFTHKSILSDQEAGQNLTLQQDQQAGQQQLGQQRFGQELQLGDIQNQQQTVRDFRLADIASYAENVRYAQETAMGQQRFEQQGALSEQSHQQNLETLGQQQDFQLGEHREDTANRFAELGLTHDWQQQQNQAQREADDRKVFDQQMAEGLRQGKLVYTPDQQRQIGSYQNSITKVQTDDTLTQDEKRRLTNDLLWKIRSQVPVPKPAERALSPQEDWQQSAFRTPDGDLVVRTPKGWHVAESAATAHSKAAKTIYDKERLMLDAKKNTLEENRQIANEIKAEEDRQSKAAGRSLTE